MSVPYYGDFAEDDTVDIPFNTFDSNDPSASVTITNFANTDVHVHKDAGLTQRNNAGGVTVSVDFDGITGNHLVKIDTSDDTVGGFWVTGSEYQVRIEGTTIDGATVNVWIGAFSIERAGGVIALLKLIQAATITNAAGADVAADIIALKAVSGALADAAAAGEVTEADTLMQYLKQLINILIGTPGIGTFPAATAPANAVSLAEVIRGIYAGTVTNAAGADVAADVIAVKAETATIVADTNELQTDLADGGRLDLLIDAIKVVTDAMAASAGTLVSGTVSYDNTAASTTVFYCDDITEATADHFNGRLVIFTSGALQYQATDITDYELDTGEGKFTVTALTEAPADNVTFVII